MHAREARSRSSYSDGFPNDVLRMGDLAGYRARRSHRRIGQVDQRLGVAHAAGEVAVGSAQTDLALAQHSLVPTQAGAAGSRGPRAAGLQEDADQPLPL